ncbi:MAG: PAS domain-containing sensor histidine kinase [Rhodospirillales bacterium]|nr:PAS domain-containing sensor histidine kinase [Rhodospirillales bacterium]
MISGFSTYAALTATPPFGDDPDTVIWLLNLDLIILMLLTILVARRIVGLWSGRRRGIAGSRLHVRLVLIFSILAATPAIIMTVFSAFFLHFGIQSWFSDRVSTAVNNAQAVAEAYLEEHQQVIKADTLAMANDIDRQTLLLSANAEMFDRVLQTQSLLRNLSEAVVFDHSGRVMASSGLTFTLAFEALPAYALSRAAEGEVVVMTGGSDDRVRALVKLGGFTDTYLFVGRMVDPVVLGNLKDAREAVEAYAQLEGHRSDLLLTFTLIFFVVALLLLLAAVWFGLIFSRQLIVPISSLISAADRVRGGDLTARVPEFDRRDEFDVLARAFNRMTSQIEEQRDELVMANRQLDHRRRFTETVLAGVSSGILGVDEQGRITLANSSAAELFELEESDLVGKRVGQVIPDLDDLLAQAHSKPDKISQAELPYRLHDDSKRVLLVRIAIEMIGEEDKGAVLTFDDITELLSAQRKAAWADVARRIAHEIKNPLTPIQLSAERLKRKYLSQISVDQEIFSQCTDTIIHHVGDIGRMVNEFSAFARMPEPVMHTEDLTSQLRDTLILQQQAHSDIRFEMEGLEKDAVTVTAYIDSQQIRQAVTNIMQNAIDSIHSRCGQEKALGEDVVPGRINVLLRERPENGEILICVMDNGLGLPKDEDPSGLTEPYVTHKEKGTGLGLAIVKKIMEDHQGRIVIGTPEWLRNTAGWQNLGGATVTLVLPPPVIEQKDAANS